MDALRAQRDFLLNCSEALILDHGCSASPKEKVTDLQDVLLVTFNSLMLKSLGQLGYCRALRICILADNFLRKLDPLAECVHLVKLDVKGNQISQLPSASFWNNLKNLQLLNLHDNSIAEKSDITALSSCPKLTALTLYDTPVSLKLNYRHCIVNSIWTLKALDKHIISDEEIVENWKLPSKFKAMSPHFGVNLHQSRKTNLYKTEIKKVFGLISEINQIQAHYCPILIIQRWIRGHLTRKSLGLCRTPLQVLQRNVTPVSSQPSTRRSWIKECKTDLLSLELEQRNSTITRLHVNINKLLQDDSQEQMEQEVLSVQSFNSKKLQELQMPCNTPEQSDVINTFRDKFNMVSLDDFQPEIMDKETFHLFGLKATMHLSEPFTDMLVSRKAVGQEVREAIDHFHSQKPSQSYCQKPRPPRITAEKRCIGRRHDCFSLVPFRVIERAYWVKEKAEDLKERAEHVAQLQSQRDKARDHRINFMEAQRREAILQQDRERADLEETLNLQREKHQQEVQLARQKHLNFLQQKKLRASEQEMVIHFSGQHGFLTTAYTRHSIQHRLRDTLHKKRQQVTTSKQHSEAQKLLVQRYLENRKQEIYAKAVVSMKSMQTFLSQKQHYDLLAAQARVANVKSSHFKVEVLHPEPLSQP